LWSPAAWGFVALGVCIGLLIGLAQVILKEAWLRVEQGFRVGRELILSRPETTIGRAEACDLGLFGDPNVGRFHARILRERGRHILEDMGSPLGTFVNDERIQGRKELRGGDLIRMGRNVLRYEERSKEKP
jgi:pSer/pThr/pTyr-binding forkhead associated (FHA) protein